MTDEINPLEAKRLRAAFKATADKVVEDVPDVLEGDNMGIIAWGATGAKKRWLEISKGGNRVCIVPITKRDLKRLKIELLAWDDLNSGHIPAWRRHSKIVSIA